MRPTYRHGDWVVVLRTGRIRPGHVVAVRDPRQPERLIVKRVATRRTGGWWLLGDDPDRSTDSRHFGPVPPELVEGRVVLRFHRAR